jgi:hypothetical protein
MQSQSWPQTRYPKSKSVDQNVEKHASLGTFRRFSTNSGRRDRVHNYSGPTELVEAMKTKKACGKSQTLKKRRGRD